MTNDERLQAWERLTSRQRSAVVAVVVFGEKISNVTRLGEKRGGLRRRILKLDAGEEGYAEDWHGMGLVVERMHVQEDYTKYRYLELEYIRNFKKDSHRWKARFHLVEYSGYKTGDYAFRDNAPDAVAYAACMCFPDAFDAALREIGGER